MKKILVYGLAGWEPEKEARVVLNAIRNLGYHSIFFCDKPNETMKLADRAEINPTWDYAFLKKVAVEEKIDLALLIVDFASPLLGRLNRELNLPGPTDEHYAAVSDKLEWSKIARRHGLLMPQEILITEASDFEKWTSAKPIIVKPTKSTGNVSREKFGYRYFNSLSEFRLQLEAQGDLERFYQINRDGSALGKYLVQERLEYRLWGNLGLTVVGRDFVLNEMHDRFFHPYPYQTHQYASLGPVPMTAAQKAHALKVCDVLHSVGFQNTGLNIDLIETPSGQIFTVDINVRFGSTWSTFLPLRKIHYFEQAIQAFLGLPYELPELTGTYLRHKVDFPPGIIDSIRWPSTLDPRVHLEGTEFCKPGTTMAAMTGRHTWPLEALITADNHEECWQIYNNLKASIQISYREPGVCL